MPQFSPFSHEHGTQRRGSAFVHRVAGILQQAFATLKRDGGSPEGAGHAPKADSDDVFAELIRHSMTLSPIVKRRILEGIPGVPRGVSLGWAQLPQAHGQTFSLGVFASDNLFSQIALADSRGRVFVGADRDMDIVGMEPRFMFIKENELSVSPAGRRRGHHGPADLAHLRDEALGGIGLRPRGDRDGYGRESRVPAIQGGIVGRDETGRMTWLASWLKSSNRYTLEQLRAELPERLRLDLEYRDAMAIAFFAAYMLPQFKGLLVGFGSGNIFRRLNREAPMGAIRRSMRDTAEARAHGMRASGLEDYFADLMREAGALEVTPGLEAVHGAEPLHLYTSSYSGNYFFSWNDSLEFAPALRALNIEGNLNRFAGVSTWLERNARQGGTPTEDTVTRVQAARIDLALLNNPALIALNNDAPVGSPLSYPHDVDFDGHATWRAVASFPGIAHKEARDLAERNPDPAQAAPSPGGRTKRGEWIYRQTLSDLVRRLKLPYRFDVELRSNLESGNAALAFTTAGTSLMPANVYHEDTHEWAALSGSQRAAMSARYNLRVGLILAALGFGADSHVTTISVHIDSIGLEEAVAEQDTAIARMMGQALSAFERMRTADIGIGGTKADPKDGDVHGDPSQAKPSTSDIEFRDGDARGGSSAASTNPAQTSNAPSRPDPHSGGAHGKSRPDERTDGESAAGAEDSAPLADSADAQGRHHDDAASTAANGQGNPRDGQGSGRSGSADVGESDGPENPGRDAGLDGQAGNSINRQFEDLMKGVDIDDMVFDSEPGSPSAGGEAFDATSRNTPPNDAADGSPSPAPGDRMPGSAQDADPLRALHANPTVRNMVTVTFRRDEFMSRLQEDGLEHPIDTYRMFDAAMNVHEDSGLTPVNAEFDLRDSRFTPDGSQEEPELSDARFDPPVAAILGASSAVGLSIQREDLLQRAVSDFHRIAGDDGLESVAKAHRAMRIVERLDDPELNGLSVQLGSALIDGRDTPDFQFGLSQEIDARRAKARDLLFSGRADEAIESMKAEISRIDAMFAHIDGVPRYFNSYAERVVYNRLFSTPHERTVLIPDNLFYAHMELADVLSQLKGAKASLEHLNAMVSYAPAYPLSHMKLAVQLARDEDWDSARAACLNALRVALDRDDAAFAYYRFAYAEWMRDEFDVAAASYILSNHIAPGQTGALPAELQELIGRADSQCIAIPRTVEDAQRVLAEHGLPVWPHTEVARIVRDAARVCVDNAMFVPARTLSVAAARMNDGDTDGIDIVQAQFLRSLNA
ncbi:MAG: tetratricopeptide repeat protein [Bifidobacterium sp.]|nr:tetratricopeptide repeat protein [Bifidobacterium sp.]MCI1864585.1 tetratricopeptide repeat protein [Bifidobacterium sp.]